MLDATVETDDSHFERGQSRILHQVIIAELLHLLAKQQEYCILLLRRLVKTILSQDSDMHRQ
jgi:hypothetical protein